MDLHSVMLTLHIIAGSVALLTMVMAYVTKKGPKAHAKIGRVYGMAMVAVGLTAAILFFLGASTFLLLIAFFSTYLVLVGWRFAKNRRGDIGAVDRWLLIMGAVGGIGLSAMAAWIAISGDAPLGTSRGFAVVPAIFAAVLIGLVVQQRMLQSGEKGPRGKQRIALHATYMGAGTIATVTAFTITVFGSNVLTWLGATVIGTPLLTWNQIGVNKGKVASSVTAMDDSTEA